MDRLNVQTSQNVDIAYEPASIGDRIIGAIIDNFIIFAFLFIVELSINNLGIDWFNMSPSLQIILFFVIRIPYFFYNLLFEIFMNGQTPGKMVRKIKVVKIDGSQPSISSYLLRWILRPIDTFMLGVFGIITMAINMKGQRLGDVAASTAVVKINPEVKLNEVLAIDNLHQKDYQVIHPEAQQLSDKEINVLKDVVLFYNNTLNPKPLTLASEKIKSLLTIQSLEPDLIFIQSIIKDHSYLSN